MRAVNEVGCLDGSVQWCFVLTKRGVKKEVEMACEDQRWNGETKEARRDQLCGLGVMGSRGLPKFSDSLGTR